MPSASIEFPLRQKRTPFGLLPDPKIPVEVKTTLGYRRYAFLVDTGADFTVAPRRLAEQVGLGWPRLPESKVLGVEGGGISARLGKLPLRIGGVELEVRCLFLDIRKALFLLGRADFLERFVLTLDTPKQRIVLTEIV